jgi:hypothetical protein
MAKKIKAIIKLQIPAGKANPAPPVGPALGQHGINIMAFCKEYNARTSGQVGSMYRERFRRASPTNGGRHQSGAVARHR